MRRRLCGSTHGHSMHTSAEHSSNVAGHYRYRTQPARPRRGLAADRGNSHASGAERMVSAWAIRPSASMADNMFGRFERACTPSSWVWEGRRGCAASSAFVCMCGSFACFGRVALVSLALDYQLGSSVGFCVVLLLAL